MTTATTSRPSALEILKTLSRVEEPNWKAVADRVAQVEAEELLSGLDDDERSAITTILTGRKVTRYLGKIDALFLDDGVVKTNASALAVWGIPVESVHGYHRLSGISKRALIALDCLLRKGRLDKAAQQSAELLFALREWGLHDLASRIQTYVNARALPLLRRGSYSIIVGGSSGQGFGSYSTSRAYPGYLVYFDRRDGEVRLGLQNRLWMVLQSYPGAVSGLVLKAFNREEAIDFLVKLVPLQIRKTLRYLRIMGNRLETTPEAWSEIVGHLPRLEVMRVEEGPITFVTLRALRRSCPRFRAMQVTNGQRVETFSWPQLGFNSATRQLDQASAEECATILTSLSQDWELIDWILEVPHAGRLLSIALQKSEVAFSPVPLNRPEVIENLVTVAEHAPDYLGTEILAAIARGRREETTCLSLALQADAALIERLVRIEVDLGMIEVVIDRPLRDNETAPELSGTIRAVAIDVAPSAEALTTFIGSPDEILHLSCTEGINPSLYIDHFPAARSFFIESSDARRALIEMVQGGSNRLEERPRYVATLINELESDDLRGFLETLGEHPTYIARMARLWIDSENAVMPQKERCKAIVAEANSTDLVRALFAGAEGMARLVERLAERHVEVLTHPLSTIQRFDLTLYEGEAITEQRLLTLASYLPGVRVVNVVDRPFITATLMATLFRQWWPALTEVRGCVEKEFDPWAPLGVSTNENLVERWREDRDLRMRAFCQMFSTDEHAEWRDVHQELLIILFSLCAPGEFEEYIRSDACDDAAMERLRPWCRARNILAGLPNDLTVKVSRGGEMACSGTALMLACEPFRVALSGRYAESKSRELSLYCSPTTFAVIYTFLLSGRITVEPENAEQTLDEVVTFALQWGIDDLEATAVRLIMRRNTTPESDDTLRHRAVTLGSHRLSDAVAARVAADNLAQLTESLTISHRLSRSVDLLERENQTLRLRNRRGLRW